MSFINNVSKYGFAFASQLNPQNWRPETASRVSKVAAVACVAFVGLTALQRCPVAFAERTYQFIYDCSLNKELNAAKAYATVLAYTWDVAKAEAAYTWITKVGREVDLLPSNGYITKACQFVADAMPYTY